MVIRAGASAVPRKFGRQDRSEEEQLAVAQLDNGRVVLLGGFFGSFLNLYVTYYFLRFAKFGTRVDLPFFFFFLGGGGGDGQKLTRSLSVHLKGFLRGPRSSG